MSEEPDDTWRCISCGNPSDHDGDTHCRCLGGLLFQKSNPNRSLMMPRLFDEEIAELQAGRAKVLETIRQGGAPFREQQMVTLRRDAHGKPTVWCDPEIADLVDALNTDKLATIWSCSGHGFRPGMIGLSDGRQLMVFDSIEHAKAAEAVYPLAVNGDLQ